MSLEGLEGFEARAEARLELPGAGVRTGALSSGDGRLPLVLEPAPGARRDDATLASWIDAHRGWVEEKLTERGAFLFRGFELGAATSIERVARAIDPELKNDYLGTSPRNALTDYVFSASELPPVYPIPQHCEMSFIPEPPRRLFFGCLLPNQSPGGETPLVDVRRVWQSLDPAVRARFEEKGVRNIRNYDGPGGGSRFDLWKLKRWDEMFRTTDRAEVEAICRAHGFSYTWRSGGRLRLVNTQPAFRRHPVTGEVAWFNHSQVFHLSSVAGEYRRIARRTGEARYRALAEVARAAVALRRRAIADEDQAMHCTYGDGAPIPDEDMERVRDAIWQNLVAFRWQRGDVVAIDNYAVAHGRMPYRGPRTVAVCWA